MSAEQDKARAFVARLLQNPALAGFSALQREENIIQFLNVNAGQLAPTLTTPQFFPGKSWPQVRTLLTSALYETIDREVATQLDRILSRRIDFTFVHLLNRRNPDVGEIARRVGEFTMNQLKRPEARRSFTGPYTALAFGLSGRYVEEIFARKSYVHFELTKVQRLRMGKDEIRSFIDLTILLKPAILLNTADSRDADPTQATVRNQYAESVLRPLAKELPLIPEQALKSAVHASVSFNENRFIEATARLAAIFATRARSYKPNIKVDRGADTPDKSWMNVARRNYKFYGFDVKVLDELYKIAAENLW